MFSLVDVFTFTMRSIAPKMWVIFEKMHQLFKTIAIDYLDGESLRVPRLIHSVRNAHRDYPVAPL